MVDTPGFCSHTEICRIAASGAAVRVALEKPFVCPQCGNPLMPRDLNTIKPLTRRPAFLGSVFAVVAILAAGAVLAQGGFFRPSQPAHIDAVMLVSLAPAFLPPPAPVSVVDTLDLPPTATLPAETLTAAEHALPLHAGRTAPHSMLRPPLSYAPSAGHRHANVHLAVSVPLIAGGQPDYPDQFQDGQSGSVTVACGLQPNGAPEQCRTTQLSGSRFFDVAVHSWLELREVRFQPARQRGRAQVHGVTMTVRFIGDTPEP